MRTAIIIALFAIITVVVGLLPANGADPFRGPADVSGLAATPR